MEPDEAQIAEVLKGLLDMIRVHDADYDTRYGLILRALVYADSLGYPTGMRLDPDAPGWPVVVIELPNVGQVSWHVRPYRTPWDGHTTEEKYARIARYIANDAPAH